VPRQEPRSRLGNPPFYEVFGKRYYVMANGAGHVERGVASWYGPGFHAQNTSNGEPYDMYAMTAAHKTLPLPSYARVTNVANGRSVVVRINDRGPFVGDRIIDLSHTAAAKLDMLRAGTAEVEVVVLAAPANNPDTAAVALAPTAPRTSAAASTAPEPMFIQAGAFSSRANADALAARLRDSGLDLAHVGSATSSRTSIHRVRIGPIGSVEEFDRMMARLAELGVAGARLAAD
jgi:rare lipoprotein A